MKSQLHYPSKFVGGNREVEMRGDLVFEVTHDRQMPFIVPSDELAVQPLGTRFNVISSGGVELNCIVHVLEGKVKVELADHSENDIVLEKGITAASDASGVLSLIDEFSANRLFCLTWRSRS